MCDPMTMMMMAGGGMALGKLYEGAAGYGSHKVASEIAGKNADILDTQAETRKVAAGTDVIRGNYDEFLTRRKVEHVLASETTDYASGNVDPTYGSPLVVQGFSAAQGETDAQIMRARMMSERADDLTAVANIYGQAAGQRTKASSEKSAARTSIIAGAIGAGTSMLAASSKWASLNGPSGGSALAGGVGSNPFMLQQPTDL